jgi:hypothetical protein
MPQFFKPEYLHLRYSNRDISSLMFARDANEIDFDVYLQSVGENLQRPFVWQDEAIKNGFDKYHYHRLLIESILSYTDIGKFVVYKLWTDTEPFLKLQVIDGKQRMQALFDFYDNKFGIFRDGVEYFKKDMGSVVNKILHTVINYCEIDSEHQKLSDNDLIELFLNINTAGVPQSENHLQKLQNLKK